MNPQKADDLLQDLKAELASLEKATADAERRRDIAISQANSLEMRNRQAIEQIETEVQTRRKALEKQLNLDISHLNGKIHELEKTKKQLKQEVEQLGTDKQKALEAYNNMQDELGSLTNKFQQLSAQVDEAEARIIQKRAALAGYADKLEQAKKSLAEYHHQCAELEKDRQTLQAMVDELENTTIEMKTQHDVRKKSLDKELQTKEQQLKVTERRLAEALNEDKAVRRAWAEEHLKLEKRTQAVKNMEAAVADAESRVAELDKFMRL